MDEADAADDDTEVTGSDLASLRAMLQLTQADLAARIGMGLRNYRTLESDGGRIRSIHSLALRQALFDLAVERGDPDILPDELMDQVLALASLASGRVIERETTEVSGPDAIIVEMERRQSELEDTLRVQQAAVDRTSENLVPLKRAIRAYRRKALYRETSAVSPQSKGGVARSRSLTAEERSQIASIAASARWAKRGSEP